MSASCPRYGFFARVVLRPDTEPRQVIRLRESLAKVTEGRGLSIRLGGTIRHWMHLMWREGSQAEHADREAVMAWIGAQPEVVTSEVGLLTDLDEE